MTVLELKKQIMRGTLDRLYIFTGPEYAVMHAYIAQMSKVTGSALVSIDDLETVLKKANKGSFLKSSQIYVLHTSDITILDDSKKSLITQTKALSDDIIIIVYSSLDKRSKLYKSNQDIIVDFEPLNEDILIRYIRQYVTLSDYNCRHLIDICDANYGKILLEINKIRIYASYKQINYNEAFESLLKEGTIYEPPYDAVFDFVDAVLKYKPKLAFKLLQESYDSGEATLVLITNLYNNTKQLLQYQAYEGNDITKATGLTPFQIKLASGRKNIYSNGDLVYLMRKLREVERGIKTGEIEEAIAIPYVLVSLWS